MDNEWEKYLENKSEEILFSYEKSNKDFNTLLRMILNEHSIGKNDKLKEALFELEEIHNKDKFNLVALGFSQGLSSAIIK